MPQTGQDKLRTVRFPNVAITPKLFPGFVEVRGLREFGVLSRSQIIRDH
jgi:hypothetical protein